MGTLGLDYGDYNWGSSCITIGTSAATSNYVISGNFGGGELAFTAPEPDDEDDRSENEKWLDSRVDEMRVTL